MKYTFNIQQTYRRISKTSEILSSTQSFKIFAQRLTFGDEFIFEINKRFSSQAKHNIVLAQLVLATGAAIFHELKWTDRIKSQNYKMRISIKCVMLVFHVKLIDNCYFLEQRMLNDIFGEPYLTRCY